MSQVSSRPRIQSVACSAALPIAAGCAFLALGAIGALLSGMSKAGKKAYEASSSGQQSAKIPSIKSLSVVSNEFRVQDAEWARTLRTENGLDQIEAEKVATLIALSKSQFIADGSATGSLQSSLAAFSKANDVASVKRLKTEVMQSLENGHQVVLEKSISIACAEATLQAGFGSVRTERTSSGVIRVIGADTAGRSLVTEIVNDTARELSITTETLGISDGTCDTIMDVFDRALEAQGVKTAVPVRKRKGGVLDLGLATDFVRSKVMKPSSRPNAEDEKNKDVKRLRALNQRSSQLNRR